MTRSRTAVLAAAATLVCSAAGGWYVVRHPGNAAPATAVASMPTVAVVRTDVIQRQQMPGILGYAAETTVLHPAAPGILTWIPAAGATVGRGQPLYELDGVPTRLLLGERPVWRAFTVGMSDGDDVAQLERNLAAMGYTGFTVDRTYSTATAYAVRRWQTALGTPHTGQVPLGSVVFAAGPLRIGDPAAQLGGQVGPGTPVLQATSTARVVSVALPTAQQAAVTAGDLVYVSLPAGQRLTGTITNVGRVASTATNGPPSSAGTAPTVPVTITLDPVANGAPDPTADLDQTPVQVAITTQQHHAVLAVPVTALVSTTNGGYDVIVVAAGQRHHIAVQPGLIDDITGLIEVTGPGLATDQQVEVPTS